MAQTAQAQPAGGYRPGGVDTALQKAVRHAAAARRCFYAVVLVVALIGQVTGATHVLQIPAVWAIPAVAALELGGIVILANADVRRRLGERAIASRLLSAAIAAWAVAFNWLTHPQHLEGGFFAVMSALGYAVWLIHAENQRRDRLRATGDLPPTAPAYELLAHWLRHPRLTLHARALAKANPGLGLYGSLTAAHEQIRRRRQHRAIATVLHSKIRATADPDTATIATADYDLDQIAARLAATADDDTLTAIISEGLTPQRLIDPAANTTRTHPAEPNPPYRHGRNPTPDGRTGNDRTHRDRTGRHARCGRRTGTHANLLPANQPRRRHHVPSLATTPHSRQRAIRSRPSQGRRPPTRHHRRRPTRRTPIPTSTHRRHRPNKPSTSTVLNSLRYDGHSRS